MTIRTTQMCDACGRERAIRSVEEANDNGWRVLDSGLTKMTVCSVCLRTVITWLSGGVADRPRRRS